MFSTLVRAVSGSAASRSPLARPPVTSVFTKILFPSSVLRFFTFLHNNPAAHQGDTGFEPVTSALPLLLLPHYMYSGVVRGGNYSFALVLSNKGNIESTVFCRKIIGLLCLCSVLFLMVSVFMFLFFYIML